MPSSVNGVNPEAERESFGQVARLYDRVRFCPSSAALSWGLSGGERDVLDLAAGTGQVTAKLLDPALALAHGRLELTALEPDPRMRAVLQSRNLPATVLDGAAECIPVSDSSFDAVIVASAWHWFDASRALTEIARVLRDDGRLLVTATSFDTTVPWVKDLYPADMLRRQRENHALYHDVELPQRIFTSPDFAAFAHRERRSAAEIVDIFMTSSQYRSADQTTRAAAIDRLHTTIESHNFDAESVAVPVRTVCWATTRTRRRHAGAVVEVGKRGRRLY